ncbi:60S ribosomal protein L6 [Ordospora colligata]
MPDDIPAFVEKHKKRTAVKPRVSRSDLTSGMIVVVLEGVYAAKRVVYLKSLENNLTLCVGPRSINGVGLFKIDERYLLATSTVLKIDVDAKIDCENVFLAERDVYALPNAGASSTEQKIDEQVMKAVKAVEYMKTYLSEQFEIDATKDFYSLKY